jgi:hypothetical protein
MIARLLYLCRREPALLIDAAETLLLMLVAFGLGLSGDQQSYIVAAVVAGLGLVKAVSVKPFAVAALTDFGRALLVVFASFGIGLTADQIAVAVTFLGLITTLIMRAQVDPPQSRAVENLVVANLDANKVTTGSIEATGVPPRE